MSNLIGAATVRLLERFGYSADSISKFTASTRIVQDLGLDGDSLEEFLAIMSTEFGVDLGDFNLSEYGNTEGRLLTRWWPGELLRRLINRQPIFISSNEHLRPITLEMIEETLISRRRQF